MLHFIKKMYQKNILDSLRTSLGNGVFQIAKGTVIAQVIYLLALPILTRLYSPSDFGVFALYTSTLTIALVFASLKYEFAIPLPLKDEDAIILIVLAFVLILFVSAAFCILILLLGDKLLIILNLYELKPFLFIIMISFIFASIYQVLNFWIIRAKNYSLIGTTLISKNSAGSAGKIFLGFFSFNTMGLILGDLLGQITGITTIFHKLWKKHSQELKKVTFKNLVTIAKEYYRFPFYSLPSAFFNTIAFQLPVILLIANYGSVAAGNYSLAYGIIAFPISYISSSISQAYLGEISSLFHFHPEKIRNIYNNSIKRIAMVTSPVILVIALSAPFFFPVFFGSVWNTAGYYCVALAIMIIFQISISTVSLLHYCGFNSWVLWFDASRTILIVLIFIACTSLGLSPLLTIVLYSCLMAGMYMVNYFLNIRAITILENSMNHSNS